MQSSPCLGGGTAKETAEQRGEAFSAAVGCPAGPDQLRCLRSAWPADLVQTFTTNRPSGYVGASSLPRHTEANDEALRLAPEIEVITGLRELHNCDFFANLP